jgi:hypothetical protein
MAERIEEFMENIFQKISGAEKVEYNLCHGPSGRSAFRGGITDDIGWMISLTRLYSLEDWHKYEVGYRFSEIEATGDIRTLTLESQTPADDRDVRAKVVTKIEIFGDIESVQERIERALKTQKIMDEMLKEQPEEIRNHFVSKLPIEYSRARLDNGISLIYSTKRKFKAKIYRSLGAKYTGGSRVSVLTNPEHLEDAIPPLEFQIKKLEEVV